jgi:hypothetical protein
MIVIKRRENVSATFGFSHGRIQWSFSPFFNYFFVEDGDVFQVLSRGAFTLVSREELLQLSPEKVIKAERCGPPVVSEG